MAFAKTEKFSSRQQQLAAFARALGHPARVAILEVLAKTNECVCGQIVEVMPLAQSTVSQHLKELKDAGLIKGTVDGPRSCYCINREVFQDFQKQFNKLFSTIDEAGAKACC
jgi:DNA-binding transcriptional ArsR family regulator